MKKFRYNKQKHWVDEIPTMEEPNHLDFKYKNYNNEWLFKSADAINRYSDDCDAYTEHLSSLLTSIPVSGEVDWVDGQIIPESDLRLKELRYWKIDADGTYRCDECCNGDRCDDPSHIDRSMCPYCKGEGSRKFNYIAIPLTSKL